MWCLHTKEIEAKRDTEILTLSSSANQIRVGPRKYRKNPKKHGVKNEETEEPFQDDPRWYPGAPNALLVEYFYKGPTDEKGDWIEEWTDDTAIPIKIRLNLILKSIRLHPIGS